MPKNHARKTALAAIKDEHGVPHHEAIAILDDPRSEAILAVMEEFDDITTRVDAVAILDDPMRQTFCEKCGWTNGMVCPECPGCGCYNGQCSGWRHAEFEEPDPDRWYECDCGYGGESDRHCCECGMDGAAYDYHCVC